MLKRLLQGEGNGNFVVAWRGADIVRLARHEWGGQSGKGEEVGGREGKQSRALFIQPRLGPTKNRDHKSKE